MRTRVVAAVASVVLAGAAFGACGGGEDRPGQASACGGTGSVSGSGVGGESDLPFTRSEADTTIPVVLKDYEFVGVPAEIEGPDVLFTATVQGSNCHELEVLDDGGDPVGEIPAFPAGEKKELGVELAPGTYTLQCLVEEGAKTHAELGMKTTVSVTGP